jgi:hypothetical protein
MFFFAKLTINKDDNSIDNVNSNDELMTRIIRRVK